MNIIVRKVIVASLLVAIMAAASMMATDAFSFPSSIVRTTTTTTTTTMTTISSKNEHYFDFYSPSSTKYHSTTAINANGLIAKLPFHSAHSSSSASLFVMFGSLRNLVESTTNDDDNDDDTKMKKNKSNIHGGADDFNNLLSFSRSKFAERSINKKKWGKNPNTLLSSSASHKPKSDFSWGGEDEEEEEVYNERGMHQDRLSPFSFATNNPKSQSQGGSSTSNEDYQQECKITPSLENTASSIGDRNDNRSTNSVINERLSTRRKSSSNSNSSSSSGAVRRENNIPSLTSSKEEEEEEDYAANNFNSMIETFYSKKKFPSRERGQISDAVDERGLHGDRLSTFSFSSTNTDSFGNKYSPRQSQSEGSLLRGDNIIQEENSTDNNNDMKRGAVVHNDDNDSTLKSNEDINDDTMVADNFNSMVGTFYRKSKLLPKREGDIVDETGLMSNRLGTFSFASNQPKWKATDSATAQDDVDAFQESNNQSLDITSKSAIFSSTSPMPQTSATNENSSVSYPSPFSLVNHNDRLGTFSFASTDPQSGSTSSGGTSATSPLTSVSDSKTVPPPSKRREAKEDANQQLLTSLVAQKGSLASIASSVSIKSRNDRIKDIKEATDPKRLHPDGMNVPRLNSKGDVMTLSSTGGHLNIFQRIGNANKLRDESNDNEDASVNSMSSVKHRDDGYGDCFIGFDLGTSGARMSIVEKKITSSPNEEPNTCHYVELVTESLSWNDEIKYDDANDWKAAVNTLLSRVRDRTEIMTRVKSICVSGTSSSCLLLKRHSLDVARSARMYNFDVMMSSSSSSDLAGVDSPSSKVLKLINQYVPEKHTACASTGSLAKLLLWNEVTPLVDEKGDVVEVFCHQSDYISMSLMWEGLNIDDTKCEVVSDWHNCLKLGYDVQRLKYPAWMYKLLREGANIQDPESVLPSKVVSPGEPFGVISPIVASTYGLSSNVVIVGGTTDSNAAFFASAGARPDYGTSVTSLGSTLAIKQLSKTFVEDASRGVYSHRFPIFGGGSSSSGDDAGDDEQVHEEAWLIGGASNVGCAILRKEGFSNEELRMLSEEIDPNTDFSYEYYPLTKRGERFPVADSMKEPVLTPKPESRKDYLHGILQGIGDVEREGYRVLGELGADPSRPKIVYTAGGGAANNVWMSMRERRLRSMWGDDSRVEVIKASNTEASYGAAILAAASFENGIMSGPSTSSDSLHGNYIN